MADRKANFSSQFKTLTGNSPFPWQNKMYEHLLAGEWEAIHVCSLPTGLGKTSVIAVWLIALAHGAPVPRRLVYIVNRRTVVDQTTFEVEKYREPGRLAKAGLDAALKALCAIPLPTEVESPLALSTLRGQFADNREWSADPCRPAVIVGTVDMIGSRLLFSGYGLGFRTRPLHAGFLGQDALIVHDEAHLEPAFQKLLTTIEREQQEGERSGQLPWPKLRVVKLTATTRGETKPFGLTPEDHDDEIVKQRVRARKKIELTSIDDEKKELVDQMAKLALAHEDEDRAVIVFARSVEVAYKVLAKLPQDRCLALTGTMRGFERDNKLIKHQVFQRFLPASNSTPQNSEAPGTVYLVCTSAGEVGVNLSADDLVCDLSTFESMAQRFGRVNRFGLVNDTRIDIVHPSKFDEKDEVDQRRQRTLALLESLNGNGSPKSLGDLAEKHPKEVVAAFSPLPTMLDATDMLFDAWALTTIWQPMPGRPPVEPYLHGIAEWQPPETHIAWRRDVELLTSEILKQNELQAREALDLYPIKPHELLRDRTDRVFKELQKIAARIAPVPVDNPAYKALQHVWIIEPDDRVDIVSFANLVKKDKEDLSDCTVLLPPMAGGLTAQGTLDGDEPGRAIDAADKWDVADEWYADAEQTAHRRRRLIDDELESPWRLIRSIDLTVPGSSDDEDESPPLWNWYERLLAADNEGSKYAAQRILLEEHVGQVEHYVQSIVDKRKLPDELAAAVVFAARFHDHGKRRDSFQRVLGNYQLNPPLAKSYKKAQRFDHDERYRHEFGSLRDFSIAAEFAELSEDQRDVVLHLIAAHHGRARPHFPIDEAFDPDSNTAKDAELATEVPRRFARLQRKYGRWGLAYLESLLRAADYAASSNPVPEFAAKSEVPL